MKKIGMLIGLVATMASAQDIESFNGNGRLIWSNSHSNAVYEVQWASSLSEPDWTNSWDSLRGLVSTDQTLSVTVPTYLRVKCVIYDEITDIDQCYARYSNALHDAKIAQWGEVSTGLLPLSTNTPGLDWRCFTNWVDGTTGMWVRVCTLKYTGSWAWNNILTVGAHTLSNGFGSEFWVSAYPELRNVCVAYRGTNQLLRMEKALGLPPRSGAYGVAELFVDPQFLFRPAPSPDVVSKSTGLAPDRTSPLLAANILQGISHGFVSWYSNTYVTRNYDATNNFDNAWPWTRLGYTYDYENSPNSPYGLSEYILPDPGQTNFWGDGLIIPIYVDARYSAEVYGH